MVQNGKGQSNSLISLLNTLQKTHPAAMTVVVWMSYVAFTAYSTPYIVLPITVLSPTQELKLKTYTSYSPSPPLMKC